MQRADRAGFATLCRDDAYHCWIRRHRAVLGRRIRRVRDNHAPWWHVLGIRYRRALRNRDHHGSAGYRVTVVGWFALAGWLAGWWLAGWLAGWLGWLRWLAAGEFSWALDPFYGIHLGFVGPIWALLGPFKWVIRNNYMFQSKYDSSGCRHIFYVGCCFSKMIPARGPQTTIFCQLWARRSWYRGLGT